MGAHVNFTGCPGQVAVPGRSVFAAALPRPASGGMAGFSSRVMADWLSIRSATQRRNGAGRLCALAAPGATRLLGACGRYGTGSPDVPISRGNEPPWPVTAVSPAEPVAAGALAWLSSLLPRWLPPVPLLLPPRPPRQARLAAPVRLPPAGWSRSTRSPTPAARPGCRWGRCSAEIPAARRYRSWC